MIGIDISKIIFIGNIKYDKINTKAVAIAYGITQLFSYTILLDDNNKEAEVTIKKYYDDCGHYNKDFERDLNEFNIEREKLITLWSEQDNNNIKII